MSMLATPTAPAAVDMDHLLSRAVELEASDLHLVAGAPATYRVHGRLHAEDPAPAPGRSVEAAIRAICPPEVLAGMEQLRDADFSMQRDVSGRSRRFRVNVFRARRHFGCAVRLIMDEIPTFEWSGFPRGVAVRLAGFRNGLVLFTGITGSGKSTSLAMMIRMINEEGGRRILTIEEPIEYVHEPCADTIITQREVGIDVTSFADGLKYGLRQDPDVILVGEIRDRETAQMALSAAETGHLVLSTMHTRDAKGAITRIADMFPQDAQNNIRTQLAMSLRAVVSQHLLPPAAEGLRRALALEVMLSSLPVSSAIRAGRIEAIDDAILGGRADGMISLDDCLRQLVQAGRVLPEDAKRYANDGRRFN